MNLRLAAGALAVSLFTVCSGLRAAQFEPLTVNAIVAQHPVSGTPPSNFSWAPDGSRYVYSVPGNRETDPPILRVHDMRTNADRVLFAAKSQSRGSRSRAIAQIAWSDDGTRIAFLNGAKLDVANGDGTNETTVATGADDPQWSPDGKRLGYVHANDLYVVNVATKTKTRLTTGATATRINGDPDWLYSEEMGVQHAYRFSPDGKSVAYLSFDESPVTDFPIQNFLATVNTVEHQRYPLAGGKNPAVSLRVVDSNGGTPRVLYDGAPNDEYVLSFTWMPDSKAVVDEIVDRAQRHLRLQAFPRDGALSRQLLRESDSRFVDVQDPPAFLHDGRSFLWLSERDGVQALYRVSTSTGSAKRLTGAFPVSQLLRIDEKAGAAYVEAFYPTRRDRAMLGVPLKGGEVQNLTPGAGAHSVVMPERSGASFIETASSFNSPPLIVRRTLNGNTSVVLFRTPDLSRFHLGTTRRLEIPSQWGTLDAQLTVPADFNPQQRYPVIVDAYGGPLPVSDGVTTNDRWLGLYTQLLAQNGFLVFSVDGPATTNDRSANARMFYTHMGEIAMAGQLAGVDWLKKQPYVDASRLGLYGWSYGGYLTAFTLTHAPGVFRTGIAGGPPADWRYYDSAYTERYMGMPRENATAYRRTSVLSRAAALRGELLLIHGSSDDNVHLMNSFELVKGFIAAGKSVDYFVYPGARHGVTGIAAQRNLDERMLTWWKRTLK